MERVTVSIKSSMKKKKKEREVSLVKKNINWKHGAPSFYILKVGQ